MITIYGGFGPLHFLSECVDMGFANLAWATVKNVDSRISQGIDEATFDNRISEKRVRKEHLLADLGRAAESAYRSGETCFTPDMMAIIDSVKAADAEISALESEKAKMIAEHRKNRRDNIDSI